MPLLSRRGGCRHFVELDLLPAGRAKLRAAKLTGSIEDFIGCREQPGTRPLSIEEINEMTTAARAARG